MSAKLPRYTLQFDEKHPYQAIFVRDDLTKPQHTAIGDPPLRRIFLDLLLATFLCCLTLVAITNHPGLWPGWLQSFLGGCFALGGGYLAVRYYSLLIALYLFTLSSAICISIVGFFWWVI